MFGLSTNAKVNPSLLGRLLTPVVYALSQGNCRQANGSHIHHSKPTKAEGKLARASCFVTEKATCHQACANRRRDGKDICRLMQSDFFLPRPSPDLTLLRY